MCVYQGIFTGSFRSYNNDSSFDITFFLENELQPTVDVGRTKVSDLPLEALIAICGIACHPKFDGLVDFDIDFLKSRGCSVLSK